MKTRNALWLIIPAIFALTLIYNVNDFFKHSSPAPGYTLVTDGKVWSFKWPDSGRVAAYPQSFKQQAINSTWFYYNLDKKEEENKQRKWMEAK